MEKRNNIRLTELDYDNLNRIYAFLDKTWLSHSKRQKEILGCLTKLEGNTNIRILKYLLLLSLDKDKTISSLTVKYIDNIMSQFDYGDYFDLNKLFRQSEYCYYYDRFMRTIDVKMINRYVKRNQPNDFVFALLTFHPNGFIREKGMKLLIESNSECALICTILRLNDWVSEIRTLSFVTFKKLIDDNRYKQSLIENIPLIERITSWNRVDHSQVIEYCNKRYIDIIDQEEILNIYMSTKNLYIKRAIYHKMTLFSSNFERILKLGMKSKDSIALKYLVNYLESERNSHYSYEDLDDLLNHKLAFARSYYITQLYENEADNLKEILVEKLFDKSSAVRNLSRFYLERKYDMDVSKIYLQALKEGRFVRIAIIGIKELEVNNSYEEVSLYLDNDNKGIVLAALDCLASLDYGRTKIILWNSLISENKHYSIRAMRILKKHLLDYDANELINTALETEYEHVRENIIIIVNAFSKWHSLYILLHMYKDKILREVPFLNTQMELCIRRVSIGYTRPDDDMKDVMIAVLNTSREFIQPEHMIQINDILHR